ncbi:MAG: NAD-dependent epimerase/dehydratase family protein [Pseudomonadales bacterium]
MASVLVFGGNGTVGIGVCSALIDEGFEVHALARRGGPPRPLAQLSALKGVHWHACDIADADRLGTVVAEIKPMFAVVAIGRLQPVAQLFPSRHSAVERAARVPAQAALEAAAALGVERVVYVSGLFPAVLASGDPAPAHLRLLAGFLAPQRAAKAAVEARLIELFGPNRGLVIRAGLVCGYQAQAPVQVWWPPATRSPAGVARVRKLVASATRAQDIGHACAQFFRGERGGGVIATTVL